MAARQFDVCVMCVMHIMHIMQPCPKLFSIGFDWLLAEKGGGGHPNPLKPPALSDGGHQTRVIDSKPLTVTLLFT